MDANRYATKKTIAQGMLDIALLTANASQLKYILQVGERHEFYTLMLILISISIIMQVGEYFSFSTGICFKVFFSEANFFSEQKNKFVFQILPETKTLKQILPHFAPFFFH